MVGALRSSTRWPVQTGDPRFNLWARELALAAHDGFVYRTRDGKERMYWKMSTDLTRPLVGSMGHHDPLDSYVTYAGLAATANQLDDALDGPALRAQVSSFAGMIEGVDFATSDPLGLGGLLLDAHRIVGLRIQGTLPRNELFSELLTAIARGLAN